MVSLFVSRGGGEQSSVPLEGDSTAPRGPEEFLGGAVVAELWGSLKNELLARAGEESPVQQRKTLHNAVLGELKRVGRSQLKSVPVYYVNANNQNTVIPSHGYAVVGHLGKGRHSGAVLYSAGGDTYRGPVVLSQEVLNRIDQKSGLMGMGKHVFSLEVRNIVRDLAGEFFASREAFYQAYQRERTGVPADVVAAEVKKIYRVLPANTMELWPRQVNGYFNSRPNAAERDLRIFERSSFDLLQPKLTKRLKNVRAIDLLEVNREFLLHRLFVDEKLGRIGTGIPSECYLQKGSHEHCKALIRLVSKYQRLPTFNKTRHFLAFQSPLVGNCNTGAASLLQKAQERNPNLSESSKVGSVSCVGIGSSHRMYLWSPISKDEIPREVAIHKPSLDALQSQIRECWSSLCAQRDTEARVLSTVPSSEFYQKQLVSMAIKTARNFAVVTSYQISPSQDRNPNHVSASIFVMLEALSVRQKDKNFAFAFMYNSNELESYKLVSSLAGRTPITKVTFEESSQERTVTWQAVVERYNHQQSNPALRIHDLQCKVFFIEAVATGLAGSQHNKFVLNDQGVAATLGASIGNRTKDHWLDGGAIAISEGLVKQQLNYFFEQTRMHQTKCAQFEASNGELKAVPVNVEVLKGYFVQDGVKSPKDEQLSTLLSEFDYQLPENRHDVLWVQNPPSGYTNMLTARKGMSGKPIGFALSAVFSSANAGDTLCITAKKVGCEAFSLISNVLKKGADVKLLVDLGFRPMLERRAKWFYAGGGSKLMGRLFVKHYQPNEALVERYHLNTSDQGVLHAKNYILTRQGQNHHVVMTGSYNLDGQSHYRSGENMMLLHTDDATFRNVLFDDFYDHSDSSEQVFQNRTFNSLT